MTDQADQTIIVRYVVEAQDAITKAKEFRAQVDSIKTQLKDMAKSSGQSYKDLSVGMQQVAKVDFQKQITDIKNLKLPIQEQKRLIQETTNAYNQQRTAAAQAYKELTQGAKTTTQSISSMIGQFVGIGFALAQVG